MRVVQKVLSLTQIFNLSLSQLARAEEYVDCISAEEQEPSSTSKCPGYDTKPSDGEDLHLKLWVKWRTPSLPLLPGTL